VVDMLAVVQTFADLSLSSRAAAAVNAIDTYALTVEQRCELVALAVWPTDITLPGPVGRAARTPDIDHRPARKPTSAMPATSGVSARGGVSTPQERAQARELFRGGSSIAAIAEQFGVTWLAARAWCRASG
jgi:hypothetical protein